MSKLATTLCFTIVLLLGCAGAVYAQVPLCPSGKNKLRTVYNCFATLTFKNGKYEGEIRYGQINGKGTYTFNNGINYVGEWKHDKMNGQGTITYPDGKKYVGEFKDGNITGQGTITYPDGRKYVGEFKDGKTNGQGTITYSTGEKYIGGWKDGKKHGQGTFYHPDGRIGLKGIWKDNFFQYSQSAEKSYK